MNLIFKNAIIIDKNSPFHKQAVDIKVEAGIIKKIGNNIPSAEGFEEIALDNLHISQGWFDSSVSLGEPGYEDRETLANGLSVAAHSGFTDIALQPTGNPVAESQQDIAFLKSKSAA
ncbi:MAG: dihydroorotase, partial [Bacteroidota bacterium]